MSHDLPPPPLPGDKVPPPDPGGGTTLPASIAGRVVAYVVAAALFALMMVTVVDVAGRNLMNRPLRGGYELSGLLLLVMFFVALPAATLADRHITVNLIDRAVSTRTLHLLRQVYRLVGALVMVVLCIFAARWGNQAARFGEVTMFLRLPLSPFFHFAAASMGLTALILLGRLAAGLRRGR
ncbi:MAG: TRAP transporter small permease [Rhodobacteraceae bacterium]|nr:TRAP transporter small permease [Paracoccaceae bacterium]